MNTKTARAFRGVLWRKARGFLILKNSELLKAGGETMPIDGDVVIPASNVDFIQVV